MIIAMSSITTAAPPMPPKMANTVLFLLLSSFAVNVGDMDGVRVGGLSERESL